MAAASLDLLELPPHRAFDVYGALMRSLRYPESDERGMGLLLEKVRATVASTTNCGTSPAERRSPGRRPACPGQHRLLAPAAGVGELVGAGAG